ncbi:MAG: hypothetical protein AB8H03_17085 [Saprospiraceae bacterium]
MKNYFLYLLLVFFLFFSCKKDDNSDLKNTLQSVIEGQTNLTPFDELVACAAGGQEGFLDDENFPLSVFFYPELNAADFKYYETENSDDDPNDLSLFLEKDATHEPLFNGFLRRFFLPKPEKDVWSIVSFIANDTLWYCKPIRLKYFEKPTQYAPELCQIDLGNSVEPIFNWQDGTANDNFIYFQVISDENGNALSGTYTNDLFFQYYYLDNVVFNVTRPGQVQPLQIDSTYNFTLMGVSNDNWVNLIIDKSFVAQ